jgi:hypothetical protein
MVNFSCERSNNNGGICKLNEFKIIGSRKETINLKDITSANLYREQQRSLTVYGIELLTNTSSIRVNSVPTISKENKLQIINKINLFLKYPTEKTLNISYNTFLYSLFYPLLFTGFLIIVVIFEIIYLKKKGRW